MKIEVKICGLTSREAVVASVTGGTRFVGFVFFPASPRALTLAAAFELAREVPPEVSRVGLVVNADDALLQAIKAQVPLEFFQLHGDESPERVIQIRDRFGLPVIKAVPIGTPSDVEAARAYDGVADRLLFDARPPRGATRPGGNARNFEWGLMRGLKWRVPWILAGGLTALNIGEAVRKSGARMVDVSSGVEDTPGHKSVAKITEFLAATAAIENHACNA